MRTDVKQSKPFLSSPKQQLMYLRFFNPFASPTSTDTLSLGLCIQSFERRHTTSASSRQHFVWIMSICAIPVKKLTNVIMKHHPTLITTDDISPNNQHQKRYDGDGHLAIQFLCVMFHFLQFRCVGICDCIPIHTTGTHVA